MTNYQSNERELDWNSSISNDSPEFVVLPEGDYDFQVVELERGRHAGSAKLPPCNKAIVHIRITDGAGVAIIKHNLFLHSRCEGLLCDFFCGIGQRKRGEDKPMNWQQVVGARGRAKVGIRTYSKEGREYKTNEIKRFYEAQPAHNNLPWPEAPQPPREDEVF